MFKSNLIFFISISLCSLLFAKAPQRSIIELAHLQQLENEKIMLESQSIDFFELSKIPSIEKKSNQRIEDERRKLIDSSRDGWKQQYDSKQLNREFIPAAPQSESHIKR